MVEIIYTPIQIIRKYKTLNMSGLIKKIKIREC